MPMIPLDLSIPTRDAFYKALSAANDKGLTLTDRDVTPGVPVVDSSREGGNTRITLTPVAGSAKVFGPAADFWYHRRSMAEILSDMSFEDGYLEQTDDAGQWPENASDNAALAAVNYKLQANLAASEITVTEITRDDTHVELEVAIVDGNLALYGALTLIVTFS